MHQYPKHGRKRNTDLIVYSAKIRQNKIDVKSYATRWSGLTRLDLSEEAIEFEKVKKRLEIILKDRIVVGIGLDDDLKTLGLSNLIKQDFRFDFLNHFTDDQDQPIGLKKIAFGFYNKLIQEYNPKFDPLLGHNPVIVALLSKFITTVITPTFNHYRELISG